MPYKYMIARKLNLGRTQYITAVVYIDITVYVAVLFTCTYRITCMLLQ